MQLDEKTMRAALSAQQREITEATIYRKLAHRAEQKNREILERIAADEEKHAAFWERLTGRKLKAQHGKVARFLLLAKVLGLQFAIRLMERGEKGAQHKYAGLSHIKGVDALIKDEAAHEQSLIAILKDERLEYAGSIVLGLNDALVELTGALAGMTLAIRDSRIVAIAGLVTGIAAAMSMAASGYLQSQENDDGADPLRSALYTGVAYLIVVAILIAPYFIFANIFVSLLVTLALAISVVAAYTFYISIAKELSFWKRFAQMAAISMGVAAISFGIGMVLNHFIGVAP
jgi:VIT1/CCC1 family predicted Fe2+/Mn2+ transporter